MRRLTISPQGGTVAVHPTPALRVCVATLVVVLGVGGALTEPSVAAVPVTVVAIAAFLTLRVSVVMDTETGIRIVNMFRTTTISWDEFIGLVRGGTSVLAARRGGQMVRMEAVVLSRSERQAVRDFDELAGALANVRHASSTQMCGEALLANADHRDGLRDLATVDEPPRGILREAFRWFGQRVDEFATEFAKSAGATSGKAAAIGSGVLLSGNFPS